MNNIHPLIMLLIWGAFLGMIWWGADTLKIKDPFNFGIKAVCVIVGIIVVANVLFSLA